MHASDLKGRAVVTLADANKVGTIDDLLFDPLYQRVVGFLISGLAIGEGRAAVPRARATAVGSDAVTVPSVDDFAPIDRIADLRSARTFEQARGTKVVTQKGELLGILDGFEIDDAARKVSAVVLAAPLLDRLLRRRGVVASHYIRQVGEGGLMVVDNAAIDGGDSTEAAPLDVASTVHSEATTEVTPDQ